jgi:serine/threonine protein phosphatase 1
LIFAVGDIHGCADELRLLINKLPLTPDTTVVLVGDYVDRGPKSREVIDTVLELQQHCHVVPLMGNHEAMFLDFLEEPHSARAGAFIYNGGSSTLASYADEKGDVHVPPEHVDFLYNLRLCYETEHNFFVHAGIPNIPIGELDLAEHGPAMLWTRGTFLTSAFDWTKVIVHGHTPVRQATILPNRINIDTGCVFRRRLTAIALPGEQLISVPRQTKSRRIYLRDQSSRRAALRFQGAVPVKINRAGKALDFETLDYSELGMYLRAVGKDESVLLSEDERIEGVVGPDEHSQVEFVGVIVRRHVDDVGAHYGVKLISSQTPGQDSGDG